MTELREIPLKPYYVYELVDPEDSIVFYIGKGTGKRALSHEVEALNSDHDKDKLTKIREILARNINNKIGVRVIGRYDTENEAFSVESTLINWVYGIDNLTNISRGRHADYMRPFENNENIVGIDIVKNAAIHGTGYLQDKIENHDRYNHMSHAEDIRDFIIEKDSTFDVDAPCYWEAGRYIAVFVNLNSNLRLIIQLTDSGANNIVFNLKPISENRVDRQKFSNYLNQYNELSVRNNESYSKLPNWENFKVKSNDLEKIFKQLTYAKNYFNSNV
ncbi:GIY-YIG nuclease family protein [Colwellia piezophila]|uniref:GIY-YIG nuclease family protein n=1 Tax=Colwellia piezophila TaxID=211668 RepID=UPI00037DC9AF|nr:GIY-YIG nuclease family protein [Colwellia piezophila]